MKKEIIIASIMAIGLFAGPAFTQTSDTKQPQQQMGGNMMDMHGQGMMGGGMMGGNMMGMHGQGMMGGGMMGGNQGHWDGMGCNGMMGGAMMNKMTPSQQQDFMNQTTELRKEMEELRFAYQEAMRAPNTSPKDLAKIEKQMLELRTKMIGKMENLPAQ